MIVVLGLIGDGRLNGGDHGSFAHPMIIVTPADTHMLRLLTPQKAQFKAVLELRFSYLHF